MNTSTNTHRPTLYSQVDGRPGLGGPVSLYEALTAIRAARKNRKAVDTVNVYTCTDRNGTALHIAYIHYAPGYWTGVNDVIGVYEIPTDALADL
ncbi:hypothetical protein [Streptomyces sp. KR80]|uniref:hypothetical protein n=1 Tax=Streptomyces sp. KR80 TaxID=3457426 RepID=UPI003FD1B437